MIFDDLPSGAAVFVDTNPLAYYFQPHPRWGVACARLVQRIETGDLRGFTSTHVLGELAHRMMTIEANVRFGWQLRASATVCVDRLPARSGRCAAKQVSDADYHPKLAQRRYGRMSTGRSANQRRLDRRGDASPRLDQSGQFGQRF